MARRVVTTVTCDLHNGDEVEAEDTLVFSVAGTAYEIDVCPPHAKEIREVFGSVAEHARRTASYSRAIRSGTGSRKRVRDGSSQLARAWARREGINVSAKGRVPESVMDQYRAAGAASRDHM